MELHLIDINLTCRTKLLSQFLSLTIVTPFYCEADRIMTIGCHGHIK